MKGNKMKNQKWIFCNIFFCDQNDIFFLWIFFFVLGCYLRSPSLLSDYEEVTESIGIEIVVVNPNKLLALVSLSWNNSGFEF